MSASLTLKYLEDRWDEEIASGLDAPELLRYRSNLLGSDLRITNFAGGNTSSKISELDPLSGKPIQVLWVKGSGGDLGSIKRTGFAALYLDKLLALESLYRGVEFEDEIAGLYPLAAFRANPVAASIDTPLHGFLPFPHVDHLHPDWAIALAASANGLEKMEEFNRNFDHKLVWVPWQRPGFELAMMMRSAVQQNPGCDGILLGGHGLFTWGETQRESYRNTISVIDQLGQFIHRHGSNVGDAVFGGQVQQARQDRQPIATCILPFLRGRLGVTRRVIASYSDADDVLAFVNSQHGRELAYLGTSCPDHFIRTKIRPMFVPWEEDADIATLKHQIVASLKLYREEYEAYYRANALPDSPALRDPSPSVVLIPGIGMFSFGKNKTEARIVGEFYTNAIHVMECASALGYGELGIRSGDPIPQAGPAAAASEFSICSNYVALPLSEAFRIEYWSLEDAKLRRQPPEKEFSRRIFLVIGGGSGIGRAVAILAAERGAHVVIADNDPVRARQVLEELGAIAPVEFSTWTQVDIRSRETIRRSLDAAVDAFGGVDVLINTAALFPSAPDGLISHSTFSRTLEFNVTANYLLADEAARLFKDQDLDVSLVFTSSANAVFPKRGSEAFDVSKAALSHLVRELAVGLAPRVRVNAISPSLVVKGSTMFPRELARASLQQAKIKFDNSLNDDELRALIADLHASRTLTRRAIESGDCAEAILFLAGDRSRSTTGHLIPVDGGLPEAFLR